MGRRPTENDNDISPWLLRINKYEKSPSMPFLKDVEADKKGVFGLNFPPSPRAPSSYAGVLGKDRDKGKPGEDGDFNGAQNSPAEKVQDRDLMERGWPGYHGLLQDKGKNIFLRRAASTSAKYDKSARRRLVQRRLGTVNSVLEETTPTKSPSRTVVKRSNSKKRERSNSVSSTKSFLTYATPPEASPTEPDATGDAGKQAGGSLQENFPPVYLLYLLSSMKSGAKRIVKSMESLRDRVTVRTFLCAMLNNVYTLNSSESVARQQLLKNIMSLSLPQTSIPPSSHNVKEPVMVTIRKLKAMPSDPTRYSRADRKVHLFLLISLVDDGAIDLLLGEFMEKMQIQITSIGTMFQLELDGVFGVVCSVEHFRPNA
ncbi:hypothetical protein B9Z19DRAFT_1120009 [Tuber borchii]|uniref:Uncharacterized protein n=1 Tax=Tuber borchii TaxID=42251 RepID=A0A2T7A583_TUBBO|nr:hypothetical protein B9Z19DRAFT_1120009 [Tuber borchii]